MKKRYFIKSVVYYLIYDGLADWTGIHTVYLQSIFFTYI